MSARNLLAPVVVISVIVLLTVLILTMIKSVQSDIYSSREMNYNLDDSWASFLNSDGSEVEILLEIADTQERRRIGLMNRLDLHYDQGMIFIFEQSIRGGFWMKNTLIYLDMIFLDENMVVVDIVRHAPPCRTEECPGYGSDFPFKYVVEVNGGWAASNGVKPGSKLKFKYPPTE